MLAAAVLTTAACLAVSTADPPPTPITIGSPASRTTRAAASTDATVGSPHGTRWTVMFRGRNASTTRSTYPVACTPGSAMTTASAPAKKSSAEPRPLNASTPTNVRGTRPSS